MNIPDISDREKMAHIGSLTVLRRARNDCAKKLRDKLVPLLNSIEHAGDSWDLDGVDELLLTIKTLSQQINSLANER
jgi:hypothetical protein